MLARYMLRVPHFLCLSVLYVCLSVSLSQAGVLPKQLSVGSHKQRQHRNSSFLMPKITESPQTEVQNTDR